MGSPTVSPRIPQSSTPTVYDNEGEKVGKRWLGVRRRRHRQARLGDAKTGMFGMKESFGTACRGRSSGLRPARLALQGHGQRGAPRGRGRAPLRRRGGGAQPHLRPDQEVRQLGRHRAGKRVPPDAQTRWNGRHGRGRCGCGRCGPWHGHAAKRQGDRQQHAWPMGRHRDTDMSATSRPLAGAGAGTSRAADLSGKEEMIRSEEQLHVGTGRSTRERPGEAAQVRGDRGGHPVRAGLPRGGAGGLRAARPGEKVTGTTTSASRTWRSPCTCKRATVRKEAVPVERVRLETEQGHRAEGSLRRSGKEKIDYGDGKDMDTGKDTGGEFGQGRRPYGTPFRRPEGRSHVLGLRAGPCERVRPGGGPRVRGGAGRLRGQRRGRGLAVSARQGPVPRDVRPARPGLRPPGPRTCSSMQFLGDDLGRGAARYHPARLHHGDPVEHRGEVEVVQGDDAGEGQFGDQGEQFQLVLDVQVVRRLVQEEFAVLLGERAGDLDALAFAAGTGCARTAARSGAGRRRRASVTASSSARSGRTRRGGAGCGRGVRRPGR
ncbi:hypothetical protein SMICM304S_09478 [Streptomyces microflavus]